MDTTEVHALRPRRVIGRRDNERRDGPGVAGLPIGTDAGLAAGAGGQAAGCQAAYAQVLIPKPAALRFAGSAAVLIGRTPADFPRGDEPS